MSLPNTNIEENQENIQIQSDEETLDPAQNTEGQLDDILLKAFNSRKDRDTILKLDIELEKFMNSSKTKLEFPPTLSSYKRLIVHRMAQYFKLHHTAIDLDNQKRIVVLFKTTESKIPILRFSDLVEQPEIQQLAYTPATEVKPVKIMKRPTLDSEKRTTIPADTIVDSCPEKTFPVHSASSSAEESKDLGRIGIPRSANDQKSYEEREEEYAKARARIFNEEGSLSSDEDVHAPTSTENSNETKIEQKENIEQLFSPEKEKSPYKIEKDITASVEILNLSPEVNRRKDVIPNLTSTKIDEKKPPPALPLQTIKSTRSPTKYETFPQFQVKPTPSSQPFQNTRFYDPTLSLSAPLPTATPGETHWGYEPPASGQQSRHNSRDYYRGQPNYHSQESYPHPDVRLSTSGPASSQRYNPVMYQHGHVGRHTPQTNTSNSHPNMGDINGIDGPYSGYVHPSHTPQRNQDGTSYGFMQNSPISPQIPPGHHGPPSPVRGPRASSPSYHNPPPSAYAVNQPVIYVDPYSGAPYPYPPIQMPTVYNPYLMGAEAQGVVGSHVGHYQLPHRFMRPPPVIASSEYERPPPKSTELFDPHSPKGPTKHKHTFSDGSTNVKLKNRARTRFAKSNSVKASSPEINNNAPGLWGSTGSLECVSIPKPKGGLLVNHILEVHIDGSSPVRKATGIDRYLDLLKSEGATVKFLNQTVIAIFKNAKDASDAMKQIIDPVFKLKPFGLQTPDVGSQEKDTEG